MLAPHLPLPALRRAMTGLTVDSALALAMRQKHQCACLYYAGGRDKAPNPIPTHDPVTGRRELTLVVDGETNRVTRVV
jgi:hypothetical protein